MPRGPDTADNEGVWIPTEGIDRLRAVIDEIVASTKSGSPDVASLSSTPRNLGELEASIAQISLATLSAFEARRDTYVSLLSALESTGVPVAFLSVCGRGTSEIRYTQELAYFLAPHEPHGLGTAMLDALFGPDIRAEWGAAFDPGWNDAQVEAERSLGAVLNHGRTISATVDVFVETPTLILLLEHKINSRENVERTGLTQLAKYSEAVDANIAVGSRRAKKKIKFFLTPEGTEARDAPDWRPMRHTDLLRRLAGILEHPLPSAIARHNLLCLIWDLMGGPLDFSRDKKAQLTARLRRALESSSEFLTLHRWASQRLGYFDIILRTMESQ